jgi:hypothetical protein
MRLSSTSLSLSLLMTACGGDDAGDEAADDTTGTDSGSDTSTMPMTMTSVDDSGPSSGTDPTLTTMTDPGSSGTTDPDSSTGSDDTSTGGVCTPVEGDTECWACARENCCDEMQACADAVANCECVIDCIGAIEDPSPPTDTQACADTCGVDYNQVLVPMMAVFICQNEQCTGGGGQCGGN